jgi:hypothetical protein
VSNTPYFYHITQYLFPSCLNLLHDGDYPS